VWLSRWFGGSLRSAARLTGSRPIRGHGTVLSVLPDRVSHFLLQRPSLTRPAPHPDRRLWSSTALQAGTATAEAQRCCPQLCGAARRLQQCRDLR
jgi:hypothetical protein